MHPTLTTILDLITEQGVQPDTAILLVNKILDEIQNSTLNLSERIDGHLRLGRFASYWDDGSYFTSNCIVNTKTNTIESITTAGSPDDDAACIRQTVTIDNKTYRIFDPDEDDETTYDQNTQIRLY